MIKVIRDVDLWWAKVKEPVSPFGSEQWELQVRTTDDDKIAELVKVGIKMKKDEEGVSFGNLKRPVVKRNGERNDPPKVVDAALNDIDVLIGNGSKGHVKVFTYDYNVNGRSGIGCQLVAIQVIDLIEYSAGGDDFKVEDNGEF